MESSRYRSGSFLSAVAAATRFDHAGDGRRMRLQLVGDHCQRVDDRLAVECELCERLCVRLGGLGSLGSLI